MNIQHNVPLAHKTWFKTGGPAQYYCEPTNSNDFQTAYAFAREKKIPVFLLGEGANILISDHGFQGLVICPKNKQITQAQHDKEHTLVTAGAGASFSDLISYCLDNNLLGLEEFSGIPGTVGGSVYINIHYFQFLLSQFLTHATVINKKTGEIKSVSTHWFNFGYDYSTLHEDEYTLIDATFKLQCCSDIQSAYARGRSAEIIRHRNNRYPTSNTCGSFFRNFHNEEVSLTSNGKKMIYVAYYLDKIGIKGQLSHGDAIVSYQHANMLVNKGNATSNDLIQLAHTMQNLVWERFGIIPQPECQLIGFETYPLMTEKNFSVGQKKVPVTTP